MTSDIIQKLGKNYIVIQFLSLDLKKYIFLFRVKVNKQFQEVYFFNLIKIWFLLIKAIVVTKKKIICKLFISKKFMLVPGETSAKVRQPGY